MPGCGFSAKPTATGWDPVHIADARIELMRCLGYTRFVAQGGDWGAQITDVMGTKAPPALLGLHSNMPGTVPPEVAKALAYALEMGLPPQTLYGLADSPIALAAWMLDHDGRSYEDIARAYLGFFDVKLRHGSGRRERLPERALPGALRKGALLSEKTPGTAPCNPRS